MQVMLGGLCFGTTGTAQALGPHATTPVTVGASRVCVAAVLLAIVMRSSWSRRLLCWPVLLSSGCSAVFQLTYFAAAKLTGVAITSVVEVGVNLLVVGLLDRLLHGERLSARWAAASALAMGGIGLLTGGSGTDATLGMAGILLAVVAGVFSATSVVLAARALRAGLPPGGVVSGQFAVAAVLLLPFLLAGGNAWLATPGGAALALYLGVVPTMVAAVLYARGLRRLPAAEAAVFGVVEPLTAALLGIFLLAERPGPIGVAGMLLAGSGIVLLALPSRAEPSLHAAQESAAAP